ncbi:LOW QUALITY PROTEIN: nodal homolog [Cottoperca gobio]|uniref:LOW QUALITY PROTEIN: nodal homolog n=1 Tax=Cottoperca gobio TaxID=56716 RepID=A0A6J2QR60_COTGO|nr:LOW QUALITY PROTEIN: nodal homolog [Cottoperca gobio]
MKGLVDFYFALLLLVDLVVCVAAQPFPGMHHDALLTSAGSRLIVQRQQTSRLPLYMMQLYRTMLTEDRVRAPAASVSHTMTEDPSRQESDSVISLVAKSCQQIGKRWSVTFDMSSMSASDNVQLAELRILLPAFTESSRASVDIYHSNRDRCSGMHCPENRMFLGRLRAHPSSMVSPSSWKVFNMTEMLCRWLQQEHSTQRMDEAGVKEEEQEGVQHLTTHNRVMMVVFSRQNLNNQRKPTLIRTAEHSKYVSLDREQVTAGSGSRSRSKRHHHTQQHIQGVPEAAPASKPTVEEKKGPLCRKVDMFVDFAKLGWSEWIVYPKQYNAFRCEGNCPTPVDETYSPTNHAYMQSLLKLHRPDKVACLSCVPTRLAPLSMLYFEAEKMVMRHHKNMVVEECGCH